MTSKGLWHVHDSSYLNQELILAISRKIKELEEQGHLEMPDLWSGNEILIASDYSFSHKTAHYNVVSFIFANRSKLRLWGAEQQKFRQKFLVDGRRMKFTDLSNDRIRQAALDPFLALSDWVKGLSVTFAIHKEFHMDFALDFDKKLWNQEKDYNLLSIVAHLIGLFVGGLSQPGQNVTWISDEDAIVSTDGQKNKALEMLWEIIPYYVPHVLHNLTGATTQNDDPKTRQLEDLLSIPDLLAGAFSEYLTKCDEVIPFSERFNDFQFPEDLPSRTKKILHWFSKPHQPLKRLFIAVIPRDEAKKDFTIQIIKFYQGSK